MGGGFLTLFPNSEGVYSWVRPPNEQWLLLCDWKETWLSSSFIFLRWHKTRELEFAHLVLSVYKVIAGFIVLNCRWKTQPRLNHYLHIFLSPTIHYNAFVYVSVIRGNRYLLGTRWMCDIVLGAAKGTYVEWNITREQGDNFFSAVYRSSFLCELGHRVGQITHYVPRTLLGFPKYMCVVCHMFHVAFGWICKYNKKKIVSPIVFTL